MVEIKAKSPRKRIRRGRTLDISISRHFWNLLVVTVVVTIGVSYLLVLRHEEKSSAAAEKESEFSVKNILDKRKPFLIYGTAWKKDDTAHYVAEAIRAGFRFIGTAAQPKHYNEKGVGDGWKMAAQELGLVRSDFFLQTIYSPYQGEDSNKIPYDPNSPVEEQVIQSVASSLRNLQTDYLDALVLHSPMETMEETLRVWKAFESLIENGTVRNLGISNCYDFDQFKTLYEAATIKPFALQNRFYDESNFDTELRAFCKENKIWYQSFWTISANRKALSSVGAQALARRYKLTTNTLQFAFLMSLGYVTPFSGTTNPDHMRQDVEIMERIQSGEAFFEDEQELRYMAKTLGMPDL